MEQDISVYKGGSDSLTGVHHPGGAGGGFTHFHFINLRQLPKLHLTIIPSR
jgi:hypothetical protein